MRASVTALIARLTPGAPKPAVETDWRRFALTLAVATAGLLAAIYGAILALDPYGRRARPGRPPTAMMDVNQRYMYPQLARSRLFDSAVFGTSTLRLLDPRDLDAALGGRFVNLAINAGTPWEQMQLAGLFLRHVPEPRTIVLGIDRLWCAGDADTPAKRLTFRPFPPWLYNEDPFDDLPQLLNFKTAEIASRVALNEAGLMRTRIRADGFDVFTPPEHRYDLARARTHLYPHGPMPAPIDPPVTLTPAERAELRFPALDWVKDLAARLPATTRIVMIFPPVHVSAQERQGSRAEAEDAVCKRAFADAVAIRPATVLDYRHPSPLTRADDQFWDQVHYRLPVASRIVRDVAAVAAGGTSSLDGVYEVLPTPSR